MRLASIDIGSNAIRFQVVDTHEEDKKFPFKKVEYMRFPLRLGRDVFNAGKITRASEEKFVKLMKVFATLLDLYEVNDYKCCATAAMREAENGLKITDRVYYQHGLKIDIIDGKKEAQIINMALASYFNDDRVIHIDVGGGSTELNVYQDKKLLASKSFAIGSVRVLEDEDREEMYDKIHQWIRLEAAEFKGTCSTIGTGGNINKLFGMSKDKKNDDKSTTLKEMQRVRGVIASHSYEERIEKLRMNKDRADVILPATDIYMQIMRFVGAEKMIVPGVGLKDGVIIYLMDKLGLSD